MALTAPELAKVRTEVRNILGKSGAFQTLAPEERRHFANDMVRVGAFLAEEPGWIDSEAAHAVGLADAVDGLKGRLAKAPGSTGADFKAGAVRQGVEQFGELVQKVDFPEFVSGLIQGVFQAIVDASLQQMQAYAELLAASAKSVDQFAKENITDAQARDYVHNKAPSVVQLAPDEDGTHRLTMREDVEDTSQLASVVGANQSVDLSSAESEQAFVNAAKLEMARARQQTMALMVLLGINRIVVTNGRINAKVVFDMKASDKQQRTARAELNDATDSETGGGATYVAPWGGGGGYTRNKHTTTVQSSIDDSSESKAAVKAQLSGDVRVNFKSETFPLERMLEPGGIQLLTQIAQPGRGAPQPATPVAPQAGAPAPAPATPR